MKYIVRFFNWLIPHDKDKVGDFGIRFVIHIPIGILMGIFLLGLPLLWLFMEYQKNEDFHTSDQAWKDMAGAIWGMMISLVIQIILLIRIYDAL